MATRDHIEPFEYVSRGLDAWEAGDHEPAERLLRQAVDAYRRSEPDGVDFALGRLGAYLLDRERLDDATEVLDEAIDRKTDIPVVWRDSLTIRARRRDMGGLIDVALRWSASTHGPSQPWDVVLDHARRADREGDSEFTIAVADAVTSRAKEVGDQSAAWSAIGVLGHALERNEQLPKALDKWAVAFAEGSDDPTTANRLSMHRERAKDYEGAIGIIEAALTRGLPANTEEQLRKRLERCRARVEGRSRSDVPAYSVRVGEDSVDLVFQARLSPAARVAHVQGDVARCFGGSKGTGTLIDVSLTDGSEVRRHTGLPNFGQLVFSSSGYGLGTIQTGRVGAAETTLSFLTPGSTVVGTASVPDAVSEIADANDLWYVGCRDGYLYAFQQTGELLWRWKTPGAGDVDDAYSRPCPYYVTSDGERAVVSSMGDIYCISPVGATIWHFRLPPDDELAEDERLVFTIDGDDDEEGDLTFDLSFSLMGMAPTVSRLIAGTDATLVGSSDGRFLALLPSGELRDVHALGEGWAAPIVDAEGTLAAVYTSETVFRWERGRLRRVAELADVPERVGIWRNGLWVQDRKRLDILDWTGKVLWSVEFSKNISSVVERDGRLICAAGVLAVFAIPSGEALGS